MKNPPNKISRDLAASLYKFPSLGPYLEKTYLKEKYKAIAESFGLDIPYIISHREEAVRKNRIKAWILFIPALLFWGALSIGVLAEEIVLFPIAASAFFVLVVIVIVQKLQLRNFIKNEFILLGLSSKVSGTMEPENQNVVCYSGYLPFVGYGIDIGGWSFTIDIDKGKKDITGKYMVPQSFETRDLYNELGQEISALNIPGLSISNKIFVNGRLLRGDQDLLPDRFQQPTSSLSDEKINHYIDASETKGRFYKVIQVVEWEGDLVLSILIRFKKTDTSLFVELNQFLLPPIREEYKWLSGEKEWWKFSDYAQMLLSSFIVAPFNGLMSVFRVFTYINELFDFGKEEKAKRKIVENTPDYDYGATTSFREYLMQGNYTQHFQKLDKEMYAKMIEKRILNAIQDFLDAADINTSEFKEREANILNNGVIVSGGNIQTDNLAVGKNAQVKTKTTA